MLAQLKPSRNDLRTLASIVSAELLLRRRDSRIPILLALIAGLSLVLTPPETASYAILTIGGLKPLMSSGTQLIVAAIVLEILLLPLLLLTLGVGHARDEQLGISSLVHTAPLARSEWTTARILANALHAAGLCTLLLVLISTSLTLREHHAPSLFAAALFLLLTIPSALLTLPIAAALDLWCGRNLLLKSAIAFLVCALLVTCTVTNLFDVLGLHLIKDNWPPSIPSTDFSLGLVSTQKTSGTVWNIRAASSLFLLNRAALLLLSIAAAAIVATLPSTSRAPAHKPAEAQTWLPPPHPFTPNRITPRTINPLQAALVLLRRWLAHSPWTPLTALAALSLSIAYPHLLRAGPVVAFLIPLLIVNRGHFTAGACQALELTSPALWRPAPTLFSALVLTTISALPILPVLLLSPWLISIHLLAGLCAFCLWLAWTSVHLKRPLLGISTGALLWYLGSFSSLPSSFDLLGLGLDASAASTGPAFALTTAACLLLAWMCLSSDQAASGNNTFLGKAFSLSPTRSSQS